MAKVNSFLSNRLKKASEKISKMTSLAQLASSGNLSSFSGIFRISALSLQEKEEMNALLVHFCKDEQKMESDLNALCALTSEVKAIHNQAAILHGERIKKAQEILKSYRDGAFSAWLIYIYGNRQTPYNFLQYYDFYTSLAKELQVKADEMPRQAIYTLASRTGDRDKKEKIIENYQGESKQELLLMIRETFPLASGDLRSEDFATNIISQLRRLHRTFEARKFKVSLEQKKTIKYLLEQIELKVQ